MIFPSVYSHALRICSIIYLTIKRRQEILIMCVQTHTKNCLPPPFFSFTHMCVVFWFCGEWQNWERERDRMRREMGLVPMKYKEGKNLKSLIIISPGGLKIEPKLSNRLWLRYRPETFGIGPGGPRRRFYDKIVEIFFSQKNLSKSKKLIPLLNKVNFFIT